METRSRLLGLIAAVGLALVVAGPADADHTGAAASFVVNHAAKQVAEYGAVGTCPSTDPTHCGVIITVGGRDANRFKRWCPNGDRSIDLTIVAGTGATSFVCQGPSGWSIGGSVRLDPFGATHPEDVQVHVVVSP